MNRRKQALFYCLMVVMTLAIIEGMAQAAYYIAYGEFNGGGAGAGARPAGGDGVAEARPRLWRNIHPYYGFTRAEADDALNRARPPRREDGVALIALLGGSVGENVADAFAAALAAWFSDNDIPLRPVVLRLATGEWRQPQPVMAMANTLALGGEYDIIVNLDGYNELVGSHVNYFRYGVFPFYPNGWHYLLGATDTHRVLVSRLYALRQREQRLEGLAAAEPWRRSALFGIVNRYLREQTAARILTLNHELAAAATAYDLASHGPIWPAEPDDGDTPDAYDLSRVAGRVWYRSSVMLNDLSRTAGAEYYHFLQPNQYVPNSKPLTEQEMKYAYDPEQLPAAYYDGYSLLRRMGEELRRQGVNYYDLTQIFADNRETLYRDDCCHLNARGNELLAAGMVQRLAPALRRRAALAAANVGDDGSITAGTALDAAVREVSPVHAVNKLHFDVRLTATNTLRYSRDDCHPGDTVAPFVVQVTPVEAANLRHGGADFGYNRYEFSFDREGGARDAAGRCVVEYELPEYDIANVLTGQYSPESGRQLWRARLTLDWGFAVERTAAGALRYSRDNCLPVHLATRFFLHITPVDAGDLGTGRAEHGYDNYDFPGLGPDDGVIDAAGRCVVERELPDYDIASILTGQYIPAVGRRLWETRIELGAP